MPALKQYLKYGSKGGGSANGFLSIPVGKEPDVPSVARMAFEKLEREALQIEIGRAITLKHISKAKDMFVALTDERLGRLFRESKVASGISACDQPGFTFKFIESDYTLKNNIFNSFLNELFHANLAQVI